VKQQRLEHLKVSGLVPYARNARTHSEAQVEQIAASISEFGFTNPVLVDADGGIIAGHGRVMAAKALELATVPCIRLAHLSEAQRRAYVIADNQIALNAGWDEELLRSELLALAGDNFDMEVLGFDSSALRDLMNPPKEKGGLTDPEDVPPKQAQAISKPGDLWVMGEHRLLCGDCTDRGAIATLMQGERADLCLTDPPYGLGEKKASGKNDYAEYVDSRANLIELAKRWLPIAREVSDAVVFSPGVTNQWLYPEPAWVLCWFYGGGQLRSSWGFNCWQPFLCYAKDDPIASCWQPFLAYGKDPSLASGNGGRPDAVNMNTPANSADLDHPCPKPVALWEWFLKRLVFKAGATLFEPFSGSGTTIIAAEAAGHRVRAIELTPKYVDVAVRRWQAFTGQQAVHAVTGAPFPG
jgi:ParB-like chromosome segregation protein Spo0J